jgi:hypothetical protein
MDHTFLKLSVMKYDKLAKNVYICTCYQIPSNFTVDLFPKIILYNFLGQKK